MRSLKSLLIGFVYMFGAYAFGGAGSSGGGHSDCAYLTDRIGNIVMHFATLGQEKISNVNGMIKVSELINIKQQLKCIPVNQLDREARSYPDDKKIELLVPAKFLLSQYKTMRLALHELFVLARYENDGEYYASDAGMEILFDHFNSFRTLVKHQNVYASQVNRNLNGTVTYIEPRVVIANKVHRIASAAALHIADLCAYFGHKEQMTYGDVPMEKEQAEELVAQLNGGVFSNYISYSELVKKYNIPNVFQSVTCKN